MPAAESSVDYAAVYINGFRFQARAVVGFLVLAWGSISSTKAATPIPDVIEFNRDVRPILSDNCFACHGPDKHRREADLRLDTLVGLHGADGNAGAVVPGDPARSELWSRIASNDPKTQMPPPASGKSISDRDASILRRWIEQGAKFEGHWSFQPIRNIGPSELPADMRSNDAVNDSELVDRLIRATLREHSLAPSPVADPVTLMRRLHFDVIGLPPNQVDVDRFVQDPSPRAYEREVDRLLASPHFGERLAIWWLDLARYADTVGYHGDQDVSVSPFREYVISSFNANKPFDQFTREQLAGDLLPEPTREQQIASGYNRLGMMSAEGGVQDKEYLAKYIAERVRNASGVWLGITLGCAECHDHKFDPLTSKDFYRFQAFFADVKERGLYAGANSDGNWGPSIKVPTAEHAAELAAFDEQIAQMKRMLATPTPELEAEQLAWEQRQVRWTTLTPESVVAERGSMLAVQSDGSILASGPSVPADVYAVTVTNALALAAPGSITAIRLEALPHDSLPKKGPGRAGNGNFVLTEIEVAVKSPTGEMTPVALANPTASYEQTGASGNNPYKKWSIAAALDRDEKGPTWGWAVMEQVGQAQAAYFETETELTIPVGGSLVVRLLQNHDNPNHTLGRFRLSVATAPKPIRAADQPPSRIVERLAVPADLRTAADRMELADYFRSIAPSLEGKRRELTKLEKDRKGLNDQIPSTLVTTAVAPRPIRMLARGNWMDESGDVVSPAVPASLTFESTESTSTESNKDVRLTRLDLANWIVDRRNPLTARVVVNRLWKLYFGAGISRRLDDLGAQGEPPSHPLVLDALASQFMERGWDVKRLVKTLLMTSAYRQSSMATEAQREADPYNRWIGRQSRFRLDAELVRDNALAISGLLDARIGGKSVKPYQPPGYWAYLNFPTREWRNDQGGDLYRRGLYTHWQRQYLHPSLLAFDAPCREECTADRPRSNTPLQSLVLLNDPTYVEAARAFAELILRSAPNSAAERLEFACRRCLARSIRPAERDVLEKLLTSELKEYREQPSAVAELNRVGARPAPSDLDGAELAAWTSVARAFLNLHETITRY